MSRKIFISCILLFIVFYIILSANYWVIQKHEKQANEIAVLLSPKYFSYSSAGCISLVTPKSKKLLGGFSDIIITRNESGEEFMCGVNAVYSLNNDENAEALNIKSYNLSGHMTLAFISTAY